MFSSIKSSLIFKVSSLISIKIGFAPLKQMALAVEEKVKEGRITSSLGPRFNKIVAISNAWVQEGVNKISTDNLIIHYIHPEDKTIGVDLDLLLDNLDSMQINKEQILALKQKLFATFKKNNILLGNLEIYSNYGK